MNPPQASEFGDILYCFLSILLEGAPYIVLGTLISGFIDAWLPSGVMDRLLPKNKFLAVIVSGLLGAVFPVCECAIVPVIRRLVKKGLPVSCAITYMLAAPVINPITVISTLSAFSGNNGVFMALSRIGMAYLVTVVIGLVVTRLRPAAILHPQLLASIDDPSAETGHSHATGSNEQRLGHALKTAQTDFLDTAMYFVIGVLITSVFNTKLMIKPEFQDTVRLIAGNEFFAVPGLMVLAVLLSLCSTTDAFIAANLANFSFVAKLAFLVFGPMVDLKLIFMYSSVFRKPFVLGLVVGLFVLVLAFCALWSPTIQHYVPGK